MVHAEALLSIRIVALSHRVLSPDSIAVLGLECRVTLCHAEEVHGRTRFHLAGE